MLLNVPQCLGQPPIMELSGSSGSNAERLTLVWSIKEE